MPNSLYVSAHWTRDIWFSVSTIFHIQINGMVSTFGHSSIALKFQLPNITITSIAPFLFPFESILMTCDYFFLRVSQKYYDFILKITIENIKNIKNQNIKANNGESVSSFFCYWFIGEIKEHYRMRLGAIRNRFSSNFDFVPYQSIEFIWMCAW